MPLFEEAWEQEGRREWPDYQMRDRVNLFDVPDNALKAIRALPFKFEDYKVDRRDAGQPAAGLLRLRARYHRVQKPVRYIWLAEGEGVPGSLRSFSN